MEVYYYQLVRNTSKYSGESGPYSIIYIWKIHENHQIVITHYCHYYGNNGIIITITTVIMVSLLHCYFIEILLLLINTVMCLDVITHYFHYYRFATFITTIITVIMKSLLHCYVLAFLLLPIITVVMDSLLPINQMRNG